MHAIQHSSFGDPDVLELVELPDPRPAPGQLRIAVEACGVHLLDTSIRSGESFGPMPRPELPMVPGREVAGVVDALGEGVDPSWLGVRVVAHLGMTSGGYAERAVVAADRAHRVPDGLTSAVAVAAIGTGRTAAGILRQVAPQPGDVVAVTSAAGGLGLLLVQAAVAAGAKVVGLAGGAAKPGVAADHGAHEVVDYRRDGWEAAVPDLDLVYDGVGGPVALALHARLRPGGRLVRYGWASGVQNEHDDPQRPVVDVLGSAIMDILPELEAEALAAAADGTRTPYVGSVYALARAADAHRALAARTTVGKVVLVTERVDGPAR